MSEALAAAPEVADDASTPVRASTRWFRLALLGVVALAIGIRLVHALGVVAGEPVLGDAFYYHHSAQLLADGEGMVFPYELQELGVRNEAADHPPLFVLYLALWSLVGLDSVEAHLVAGALLGGAAVALSGLLGRRVAGPAVGLVAAALVAVYPNLITWDSVLLSEPTATVTTLLVLLAAYDHLDRRTSTSAALLGGAVGLATLARPELILLSVLVAVPVVLGRSSLDPRRRAGQLVVAGVAALVLVLPWVGYNLSRFREPVLLSTNLGVTLVYTNCDSVYDGPLLGYWDFRCGAYALDDVEGQESMDQSERSAVLQDHALSYVDENRGQLPMVALARAGRVLGVWDPGGHIDLEVTIEGRDRTLATIGLWAWYGVAIAGAAGFVLLGRAGTTRHPLAAPIITVVLAAIVTYGTSRFRASAEPVVCVLAAVAVVHAVGALRRRRSHAATVAPPP